MVVLVGIMSMVILFHNRIAVLGIIPVVLVGIIAMVVLIGIIAMAVLGIISMVVLVGIMSMAVLGIMSMDVLGIITMVVLDGTITMAVLIVSMGRVKSVTILRSLILQILHMVVLGNRFMAMLPIMSMVVYMTVLVNRSMAMLPIMSMVVFSIMSVGDNGISVVIPIGNTLNSMLIGEDLRNRRKVQTISSIQVGSIQVGSIQVVTMVTRGEKTLLVVMLSGIVVSSKI